MEDPLLLFDAWLDDARACAAIAEPTAMALATATADGRPSVRIVLLKAREKHGFVFYTNVTSRKGGELLANPHAALCFYWMALERQVRIEGSVVPVSDTEAEAYFASRTRLKQAGAWASHQSEPMEDRDVLETRVAAILAEYEGKPIPRPPFWSGFRVAAERIEFWHQREGRLHERDRFTRAGDGWQHQLLYP